MARYVIMPKLGFNMVEGKIVRWLKREGEKVAEQEPILQIETDKSVIDVESQTIGILRKILAAEGETVPVTFPIAIIANENEDINDMLQEALMKLGNLGKADSKQYEKQLVEEISSKNIHFDKGKLDEIKLSPRAKKKAQELKLDLELIKNTISQKIVMEKDIIEYLEKKKLSETIELPTRPQEDRSIISKKEPYSGMRKIIGDRLSHSKFTAPHIYFSSTVDMTNALHFVKIYKDNKSLDFSINDLLIFVTVKTLIEYPQLNSSLVDNEIFYFSNVNIGIAVGLEDGLIVPVIKKADKKNLIEISQDSKRLISLAREKKLLPEDYQGGTFTISNLGMYGIEQFTAIINPPESAILAVGKIQKIPIVDDYENIIIKPMLRLTLSVDHRIIDGIIAANFLKKFTNYLTNPGVLLLYQ